MAVSKGRSEPFRLFSDSKLATDLYYKNSFRALHSWWGRKKGKKVEQGAKVIKRTLLGTYIHSYIEGSERIIKVIPHVSLAFVVVTGVGEELGRRSQGERRRGQAGRAVRQISQTGERRQRCQGRRRRRWRRRRRVLAFYTTNTNAGTTYGLYRGASTHTSTTSEVLHIRPHIRLL